MLARAWRRESSLRLAKIWLLLKRTMRRSLMIMMMTIRISLMKMVTIMS